MWLQIYECLYSMALYKHICVQQIEYVNREAKKIRSSLFYFSPAYPAADVLKCVVGAPEFPLMPVFCALNKFHNKWLERGI
jgi:hypothetical protein